jgi:capsular polysaccharide transport system ATP-binding protein
MIILHEVTKLVASRPVLSSASIKIPSDRRIALVGGSDREKDILIGILAGGVMPSSGRVERRAEVSFPVGSLPGFSKEFSVRVNVAHVARLYGANVRQTVDIVETAFNSGAAFDKRYEQLSRDLRKPLAQIVAFALPFDVYALTDDRFQPPAAKPQRHQRGGDHSAACFALFKARLRTSGMIIPTNDTEFIREYCDAAMLLDRGRLRLFDDPNEAVGLLRQARRKDSDRPRVRRNRQRERIAASAKREERAK